MNDEPEDDDVHLGVPNPHQVAQDQRNGPQPPDLADQFPGAGSGPPQGSIPPDTVQGPVTNKHLREAVVALMQALGMIINHEFKIHLDQLEWSNVAGKEMVDGLSKGENPSPPDSQARPKTAEETAAEADRVAALL